jgi:hypothetical protein
MNRLNQILIGLLVVQVGLALLVFLGDDEATIGELKPVVTSLEASAIDRIQVFDRRGDPEDKGAEEREGAGKKDKSDSEPKVVLERRGSEWVLASHHDYPAVADRVTELLDKVMAMRSRGPVASGTARQRQLEVAEDRYQRKLVLSAGKNQITLYVGASAGARQTSVRLEGQDQVHGVSGVTSYGIGADPSSWVDTTYFKVDRKEIASFEVVNRNGSFLLEQTGENQWSATVDGQPLVIPKGSELNTTTIDELVAKLASIHMVEPGDPARQVSSPLATVTIRTRDPNAASAPEGAGEDANADAPVTSQPAAEYVLDIAEADAGDRNYVRVRGNSNAAQVSALSVTDLPELSRDRLVRKEGEAPPPEAPDESPGVDPHAMPEGLPPGLDIGP